MTLQSSGPILASQIQAEFTGENPISISEYYGADIGVPTEGAISWSDFYGKSNDSFNGESYQMTVGSRIEYGSRGLQWTEAGYHPGFSMGNLSPTTYQGRTIPFFFDDRTYFFFAVNGSNVPGDIWSKIEIVGGLSYNRLDTPDPDGIQQTTWRDWRIVDPDFFEPYDGQTIEVRVHY